MQGQHGLLLHALDRHEPHLGPGPGHAQGRGIRGVVLLAHSYVRRDLIAVPGSGHGRREPACPWVQQGRAKTWRPAGHVLATRTVTRADQPASSENGSWTRLLYLSASTSRSAGSTSTSVLPARASPSTMTPKRWRRWSSVCSLLSRRWSCLKPPAAWRSALPAPSPRP